MSGGKARTILGSAGPKSSASPGVSRLQQSPVSSVQLQCPRADGRGTPLLVCRAKILFKLIFFIYLRQTEKQRKRAHPSIGLLLNGPQHLGLNKS